MAHPLSKFKFCPACGSTHFTVNNAKSKACADCGFVYYANPSAATAAFILNKQHDLLVVRRAKQPAKGTLDLPGGFCDMSETVDQGVTREVREETGLHVDRLQYLFSLPNEYRYSGMVIHTLDMFFVCHVDNLEQAHAADDAASLRWMPLAQVKPSAFGLASVRKAVERFLDAMAIVHEDHDKH